MIKEKKYESVKLTPKIVSRVRANKKKTGIPINLFIEQAITEKLSSKVSTKDLISFGEFLLSNERSQLQVAYPLFNVAKVDELDIKNWLATKK